jgi:DNA-binding IclR family transcriptional regulator
MKQAHTQSSTVVRAFDLLRCFSLERAELSVTQLSQMLGVHKSTVSRLLATLNEEQIVSRDAETGKYRLGIGLLELAGRVALHADLRQAARPFLRRLSEITQETVNLAVMESGESVNIEQAVSFERHISGIGWLGRRTPLHASSTGKVLLAYQNEETISALLQHQLASFTEKTITDPEALRDELAKIRLQGYATGLEELEIGLNAIAAPVWDHYGEIAAALSVTGPSPRLTLPRIQEQIAAQVIEYAKMISRAAGYSLKS